jgi:membrane protease YdiL (CAAX protease family)
MNHQENEGPDNSGQNVLEPANTQTGILHPADGTTFDEQYPGETNDQIPIDPDRPTWGVGAGLSAWLLSVGAIILVPFAAVMVWLLILIAGGRIGPSGIKPELLLTTTSYLIQVLSTMLAHLLTIAICWAIVTGMGKRPFWASLGWNWARRSPLFWTIVSAIVLLGLGGVTTVASRFLPQSENTPFEQMLKSGASVRVAVAALATLSAPLVEEIVYRGVLFGGLRRRFSTGATIVLVTVAFVLVHVPQYMGAWVSLTGLTLLSLVLTVVRARTASILPSVWIHLLNNGYSSVLILLGKV